MPDLGTKHECGSCGVKYYDLGKQDPICPKCETPLGEEGEDGGAAAKKKKKKKKATKKKATKKKATKK